MNSDLNGKSSIAIHEAAHAVFSYFSRNPSKKLYIYEKKYNNRLGEMIPIIIRRYDILSISLTEYNNPDNHKKIIDATKSYLFTLIAGNCAEKFYQNQFPDYPPDLRQDSDGYFCFRIIEKLCKFHKKQFNQTKFNQVYYLLMNTVYNKIKSDKHLFDIIERIAKKLMKSKNGIIGFYTMINTISCMLIWKVIFHKYKPYPFLDVSLIEEIEK